jgi:hypothetical protein
VPCHDSLEPGRALLLLLILGSLYTISCIISLQVLANQQKASYQAHQQLMVVHVIENSCRCLH